MRTHVLAPLVLALASLLPAQALADDATKALMGKSLVDIGGRHLNLICLGQGSPTVVFEQGFGSPLLHWQKIAGKVSQITRACFYDRAGHGFSDPSKQPANALNVTSDLHNLLSQAGVKGRIVLVGHSLGGLFMTLYADRFFSDVSGIVLIDPSFADQDKNISAREKVSDEVEVHEQIAQWQVCAAMARSGNNPSEGHPECFAASPNRSSEEIAYLKRQFARADEYEALISELENFHAHNGDLGINGRQEMEASRSFGAVPLIVLTRGNEPKDPEQTDEEYARSIASWKEGHDKLAARSTRGQSVVVADSGHYIQIEQPAAVMNAIRTVVEAARAAP